MVEINAEPGRMEGLKDYYTEEKGYYYYYGKIKLQAENRLSNTFHFSKKRMELMKVYLMTDKGPVVNSFANIKINNYVEIEESVDLAISNIDDKNVLYLVVRIYLNNKESYD